VFELLTSSLFSIWLLATPKSWVCTQFSTLVLQ
jgi:hypothetical protein